MAGLSGLFKRGYEGAKRRVKELVQPDQLSGNINGRDHMARMKKEGEQQDAQMYMKPNVRKRQNFEPGNTVQMYVKPKYKQKEM